MEEQKLIEPATLPVPTNTPTDGFPKYAAFYKRFLAIAVDYLFCFWIIAPLLSVLIYLLTFGTYYREFQPDYLRLSLLHNFDAWLIFTVYQVLFTVYKGQTLGKQLFKIKVVNKDSTNENLTWDHAIIREFGRLLSSLFFFLGYMWTLIDDRRQAWHDHFGESYVVDVYESKKVVYEGTDTVKKQWGWFAGCYGGCCLAYILVAILVISTVWYVIARVSDLFTPAPASAQEEVTMPVTIEATPTPTPTPEAEDNSNRFNLAMFASTIGNLVEFAIKNVPSRLMPDFTIPQQFEFNGQNFCARYQLERTTINIVCPVDTHCLSLGVDENKLGWCYQPQPEPTPTPTPTPTPEVTPNPVQ